jgi:hypothetical protein
MSDHDPPPAATSEDIANLFASLEHHGGTSSSVRENSGGGATSTHSRPNRTYNCGVGNDCHLSSICCLWRSSSALFQSLTDAIPPPVPATKRAWRSWISAETWKMVDEHSALQRCPNHNRTEARRLHRRIQQALRADRKRRAAEAGEAIKASLTQRNYRGAWNRVKAWYRQAGDRPSKPS